MRKALFVTFFTAACSGDSLTVAELEQRAESVNDCCTIETGAIGKENHLVRLGSRVVLVHDWVQQSGKYTGFSLTVSNGAAMRYIVKAGKNTYNGSQDGFDRDEAITYVDFCGECDAAGGCDGDGGGEPSCPGGDGCPESDDDNVIY